MADKSGEAKNKDEAKLLADKDLEGVQGGSDVQNITNAKTIDPLDPNRPGWVAPPDPDLPGSR